MVGEQRSLLVILTTLLIGLLLSISPFPSSLVWGRPEWIALLVIYWVLEYPHWIGVGWAWVAGLLLDGLEGAVFGQNALTLSIVAYLVMILYQRMRMYSAWQQASVVFVLVGLHQLLSYWVQTLTGRPTQDLWFLFTCLISALIWPALITLLNGLRYALR